MFDKVARPIVESVIEGMSGTVLAYGQVKLSLKPLNLTVFIEDGLRENLYNFRNKTVS